jgi:plastocyanin
MTSTAPRPSSWLACTAFAVALIALASGCGDSGYGNSDAKSSGSAATSANASGRTLKLAADDDGGLYFNRRKLAAPSGTVTLVMDNPKTTGKPHGIAVEGNGVDKDGPTVKPGRTSTLTVALKPGRYTFYCPVPGHRAGGMKGTLTIK